MFAQRATWKSSCRRIPTPTSTHQIPKRMLPTHSLTPCLRNVCITAAKNMFNFFVFNLIVIKLQGEIADWVGRLRPATFSAPSTFDFHLQPRPVDLALIRFFNNRNTVSVWRRRRPLLLPISHISLLSLGWRSVTISYLIGISWPVVRGRASSDDCAIWSSLDRLPPRLRALTLIAVCNECPCKACITFWLETLKSFSSYWMSCLIYGQLFSKANELPTQTNWCIYTFYS